MNTTRAWQPDALARAMVVCAMILGFRTCSHVQETRRLAFVPSGRFPLNECLASSGNGDDVATK